MTEPGPQLDRLVAEFIGDVKTHEWICCASDVYASLYVCERCGLTELSDSVDSLDTDDCIRQFSTSWDHAMLALDMVVGEPEDQFPANRVEMSVGFDPDRDRIGWHVILVRSELDREDPYDWQSNYRELGEGEDVSGPAAICFAILNMKNTR